MGSPEIGAVETQFDEFGEVVFVNESGYSDELVESSIAQQYPDIARAINSWAGGSSQARRKSVFDQNKYVKPRNFFDELEVAAYAAKYDDVVSNAVDTTEQLAFKRVKVEVEEPAQNDVWDQMIDEIDLAQRMREIWRELFIYSQCYVAVKWRRKSFKPEVNAEGSDRPTRKTFNQILVPTGISILDPLRVIPVGTFIFGEERLAYIADDNQIEPFNESLAGENSSDLVVKDLIEEKYEPSKSETKLLSDLTGISDIGNRLYLLKEENVFKVTSTRPSYQRTADVRMASIFELLDLKHILREVDRTELLSSTNAIILVKRGSDEHPTSAPELAAVKEQVTTTSRIPLIISDHRIEIQIITRKTDKTLATEKYNGLDSRITSRLYQILSSGNYSSGTAVDDSPKLFRIISSTMEARRDSIRDAVMTNVVIPTWEKNNKFEQKPEMKFYPRRIALDFDNNIAVYIQDLKDRNIISAETQLAELDIQIDNEIGKIRRENELYGDVLQFNQVPYSAPIGVGAPGDYKVPDVAPDPKQAVTPKAAGRQGGGNKNGGGKNPEGDRPNPQK